MKIKDFSFEIPAENIAQFPPEKRGESRMMLLDRRSGNWGNHAVFELPELIESGSLFVFNNSRVRKARIFCIDEVSGKKAEFLLLEQITDVPDRQMWKALMKRSKRMKAGRRFVLPDGNYAEISDHEEGCCHIAFNIPVDDNWLDCFGHIPLPPYIKRSDEEQDDIRYQTIFADKTGSAAAPTAGLHFTSELLETLRKKNIMMTFITLHVGLGTFLPVHVENIEDHKMHTEHFYINDDAAEKIESAKREGRNIIAVGTTTLRALESAWNSGRLRRGKNSTSLFIYGDYQFHTADMLFTNFHTPESTLLMLVSSFCGVFSGAEAGRKMILNAYNNALTEGYRFFSYGDAMLII
ncbi:MAG: tRNA preQ1(34) S-adenosylmethionine ribosyltransferase-isomerase QueA [Spirochaetaceae bacterium]|jgi:S-adenosylmethionine:tRNA ribosyltransferase-isomerase|nr:tRNA preQ1(34) S-adenosylmethionine ribosyltransferase-isomerase QueA [Spirochaetaceae bacterium]